MSWQVIPALVGAPLCAFLAVLFLATAAKGFRPKPYGALGWLALLGAVQLAGYAWLRLAGADEAILAASRIVTAGTILMGPGWVQLALSFTERPLKKTLTILYGIAALFLALLATPWLVVMPIAYFGKLGIERQASPGPLYLSHLVFFSVCIVLGLVPIVESLRRARRENSALPAPLADTLAEEGVPVILATVGTASVVGLVDLLQLLGVISFSLPVELGALLLIAGSAYATVQRFPRLLLRVEAQLSELTRLNQDLEKRNEEIGDLARRNEQLLGEEIRYLKTELAAGQTGDLVGNSEPMRRIGALLAKVAPQEATVLLLGETGVGKEKIARELHRLSARSQKGFFAVNAGALPETLLESELFGHVRGAFTGAVRERPGIFQAASGGTLFLDEVGDMPPALQVKLLRVLQEREVVPLGSERTIAVDVRVVAATHRDLTAHVAAGKFREDLYYRLNVVSIAVPPLRGRSDDIPVLALHFLKEHATRQKKDVKGISEAAERALLAHSWPGNVRELENAIERAVTLCEADVIRLRDLPPSLLEKTGLASQAAGAGASQEKAASEGSAETTLDALERAHILRVLECYNWERGKVSELLGISPSTLYRKLKRYGIEGPGEEPQG